MRYAFCASVTWSYMYGINATMNTMKHYNVNADWELAYALPNIEKDKQDMLIYMKNASKYFPFKVNWTEVSALNAKYKAKYGKEHKPNELWIAAFAIATDKIDDYDAICIIQADEFLLYGVEPFFRAVVNSDNVIISEHFNNLNCIEELPFGREDEVYDQRHSAVADLMFASKINKRIFEYCVKSQLTKAKRFENHPITALNRAITKYLTFNKIMPLERNLWFYQKGIKENKLTYKNGIIYNHANSRIKGWHNRWWQDGMLKGEIERTVKIGDQEGLKIFKHNAGIAREAMEFFNNLTPETKIELNWKLKL